MKCLSSLEHDRTTIPAVLTKGRSRMLLKVLDNTTPQYLVGARLGVSFSQAPAAQEASRLLIIVLQSTGHVI